MRDFTLLIPTCDRPRPLAALLGYLEMEKAGCQVLVLDSSRTDAKTVNRAQIEDCLLDIERVELPESQPGEILRQGIRRVLTPFCAVCADEDLFVLEGMQHCLDALRASPGASVAYGCSFSFMPHPDDNVELNELHFASMIEDASPLGRLTKLCGKYQTLSCGVFRTPVLQQIFDALQPVTKAFARDLLWSALVVIAGQPLFQPHFSYGRRMRVLDAYNHWRALEWLCKNPEGLFAEYLPYREILVAAVTRRPDNDLEPNEVRDLLDLIHLRYLFQHALDSTLQFIAEQQIAGSAFEDYWPRGRVDLPLRADGASERSAFLPLNIRGRERSYLVSSSFYAPRDMNSPPPLNSIVRLLAALDHYRPSFEMERNSVPAPTQVTRTDPPPRAARPSR